MSIGQLLEKGYRVYMEDSHCLIKDICSINQLTTKVPMKRNHLFPLRISPNMKGKENSRATFKEKSKEARKQCDKEEKEKELQATFQS